MATNFAAVKTEVQLLLIDNPTAIQQLTGTFVNRALTKLQTKHDFFDMRAEATYTTTQFTRNLGDRPSDWKKWRGMPYGTYNLGGIYDMVMVGEEADAKAKWGTNPDYDFGMPGGLVEVALDGHFDLYPYPDGLSDYSDGEYRITIPYWRFLSPLISDTDTNWLLDNGTEWITYSAVAMGFWANEDETRAQFWDARAVKEYKDVIDLDKTRRLAEAVDFVPHLGALRPHTQG